MNHSEWVKNQFSAVSGRAIYRDVIIHASFIETVTKAAAKEKRSFECAIKILRADSKYRGDKLNEVEQLRKLRNRMIHDLLKDSNLTNSEILATIRKMKIVLKDIYHHSLMVQEYFTRYYDIDTRSFR